MIYHILYFIRKSLKMQCEFSYLNLCCTETKRNLCTVLVCTIRNIVRFPANNFDYNPGYIHILHEKICPNIFQKPPVHQVDMARDFRPWIKFRKSVSNLNWLLMKWTSKTSNKQTRHGTNMGMLQGLQRHIVKN